MLSDTGQADQDRQTWRRRWLTWSTVVIAAILVAEALRATAAVTVPVVSALFVAFLVAPLDAWVGERVPGRLRWLGQVAAMGVILLVFLGFTGVIWLAAQQVVGRFPGESETGGSFLSEIGAAAQAIREGVAADPQEPAREAGNGGHMVSEALRVAFDRLGRWASHHATNIMAMAGTAVASLVLGFFLTLMMLVESSTWRKKTNILLGRPPEDGEPDAVGVISRKLRRFLLIRTALGLITGALYAAWLWIFGIDLLLVWGLLAFLLNYLPTIGSFISGVLAIGYAFVQTDTTTAMAVGVGLLAIEQVMGNYVDPRLQGRQLAISPLVVLVALLFWGWLWGIVGALLAVPITIAALVICSHVQRLRPVALILGDFSDPREIDQQTH